MNKLLKFALGTLIIFMLVSCSFTPSPETIVTDYSRVLSSHDVDSLMTYYSDDIVFDIPQMSMYLEGKNALRGVAEYDSVLGTIMTLGELSSFGDTVFCSITEKNKWLTIAGIDSAYYPKATFIISNNHISVIQAELSDSTERQMRTVMSSFIPWLNENFPHYVRLMMPDGKFIFNAKHGELILMLLSQWSQQKMMGFPAE